MRGRKPVKRKSKKQKEEQQNYQINKRRRIQNSQTPNSIPLNPGIKKETLENKKKNDEDGGGTRFFGCYLLTSLSPRFKGHSYIGFTVNPKRRIRQHNGEITSGAFRTKKKRPWEMALCIHGFPSNIAALQFEWAWQHPRESVAVREAAASFKTLGGLANKIKLGLTMLTLPSWQSLNLTVSVFSTKYMKHVAGSPSLPHQMKLHSCSMDELPCYMDNGYLNCCDDEDDFDSTNSEVSANFSDDRLESSTDDSMELNLPSIYDQSCTIQKTSDNILPEDDTGSMENESSSMMGTLQSSQLLHQLTDDVNGSNQSISSQLLQPCEEFWIEDARVSFPDLEEVIQPISGIDASENKMFPSYGSTQSTSSEVIQHCEELWIEEVRASFPDLEEDMQPISGINASKNEMFPFCGSSAITSSEVTQPCEKLWIEDVRASFPDLEEDMQPNSEIGDSKNEMFPFFEGKHPSCHLPVDFPALNGNFSNEFIGFGKEIEAEELRGSLIEEQRQQTSPLGRHQSSMVGFVSSMEDVNKKDEITCTVLDDITKEQCQPTRAWSPCRCANTAQPFSSQGIEVIELCSSSPDFRITRGNKKKRFNSDFPDIIDLTGSPSVVQL